MKKPSPRRLASAPSKNQFVFIYVTCPSREVAHTVATHCVREKLAACANISSAHESVYKWKGRVQTETEIAVILKTRASLFKKVEKAVVSLHPYDVPCIVALPITAGFAPYLKWLQAETL